MDSAHSIILAFLMSMPIVFTIVYLVVRCVDNRTEAKNSVEKESEDSPLRKELEELRKQNKDLLLFRNALFLTAGAFSIIAVVWAVAFADYKERVDKVVAEQKSEEQFMASDHLLMHDGLLEAVKTGRVEKIMNSMVKCNAGTFMMGSQPDELGRGENEFQHQVTIDKDFYICRFEVTQSLYNAVMGSNPSKFRGDYNPVDSVNWYNAKEFCHRLNEITNLTRPMGYVFDLPTEAQWEYACRAGTTTSLNSGKNILSDSNVCENLKELGWYQKDRDSLTHIVGMKKPNAWGIYDMHGNVWEWCRDEYYDYITNEKVFSCGIGSATIRIIRGGSCRNKPRFCRSAFRNYNLPIYNNDALGFRFALVPKE